MKKLKVHITKPVITLKWSLSKIIKLVDDLRAWAAAVIKKGKTIIPKRGAYQGKTKNPTTKSDSLKISTDNNNDLLKKVKEELQKWKNQNVLADNYKKPREINIYTQPFPGEGTLLKFEELIKDVFGVKGVNISKSEQEYKPNEQ